MRLLLGWAWWRRKMELNISSLILHLNSHSKPKHLLHFFMTKSRRHETSIFKIKRAADWILQINDDFIYLKTKQFLLARFPEAPQPQPRLGRGCVGAAAAGIQLSVTMRGFTPPAQTRPPPPGLGEWGEAPDRGTELLEWTWPASSKFGLSQPPSAVPRDKYLHTCHACPAWATMSTFPISLGNLSSLWKYFKVFSFANIAMLWNYN